MDDARSAGVHDFDQVAVDTQAEASEVEAEAVWSAVSVDPSKVVQDTEDQGLVVVGVHTPEFPFERDVDNVRQAVRT